VIVDKKDTADDSLLLYFVASKTVDVDHLRTFLLHKMPAYMVPSHFIQLEELPLTINGKVDRSRLPQPAALLPLKKESANLTSEEKRLAEIWTNVLGIAGIDAEDSFFNLGGNSLKLIQLSHHIQKEFGKKIVYADLYGNLVLRNQFQLIRASENRNIIGLAPALTEYPLSHSQKRILIASQDREGSIAHHMPSVFLLEGNLDANNLEKAFELVIDRHEILRSAVYLNEQNEPCQKPMTVGETGFSITVSDFRGQNLTEESPEIVALIEQTTAEYLDIANGQVLRVNLFHLSDSRVVLHLVLHHVVGDEWSVYLLTRDLLQAYESLCNSPQVDEIYDPLQIQFKDYAFWEQTNFENSESFDFWKNQFTRPLEQLRIPGAKMDEELSMQGGHHAIQIELEAYRMAKDFIVSCGVSNAAFFASALYTLFSKYANAKDVLLGMISAQRENVQLADQMGPFLNMLPLRLNFEHEQSLKDLVIKTAKLVSGSIKHGHIPLESIREEIYPKQSGNFQIVLNVMNNLEVQASQFDPLSSIQVTPLQSGYESSKFPLTFYVFEQADYFNINIEYQVDKFDQERIVEIGEMLLKVIGEICANPAKTVGDCELFETVELPAFTRVER
jgi:acyl carrier protein